MDFQSPKQFAGFDDLQTELGRSRLPPNCVATGFGDGEGYEVAHLHWYSIFDPRAPESVFDRHYWVLPFNNPYAEGQYRAFITTRNWSLMIFSGGVGIAFIVVVFGFQTHKEWYGILNLVAGILLLIMAPVIYLLVIRNEQKWRARLRETRGSTTSSRGSSVKEAIDVNSFKEPEPCAIARAYEWCAVVVLLLTSPVQFTMYMLKAHCYRGRTGISDYPPWRECDLDYAVDPEILIFFLVPMTICTLRFVTVLPIMALWLILLFAGRAIEPVDTSLNAGLGSLVFLAIAFSTLLASFAVDLASRKRFEQLARLHRTRADLEQRQESVESILAQLLPVEAMNHLHTERILVESSACCSIAIFALDDFHRCSWEYNGTQLIHLLTVVNSLFDHQLRLPTNADIIKVGARADRYIVSCGLRQSSTFLEGVDLKEVGTGSRQGSPSPTVDFPARKSAVSVLKFSQWQLRQLQRLESVGLLTPFGVAFSGGDLASTLQRQSQPRVAPEKHPFIWKAKVAVGTGSCAGGVIGFGSLYYEVVGAAPRLADKVLLYGPPSQVTVCQRTADLVRQDFAQTPFTVPDVDAISDLGETLFTIQRRRAGAREAPSRNMSDYSPSRRSSPPPPHDSDSSSPFASFPLPKAATEDRHDSEEFDLEMSSESSVVAMERGHATTAAGATQAQSIHSQFLTELVNRLRERHGFSQQNEEGSFLAGPLGMNLENALSPAVEHTASPQSAHTPITTRLADTEMLATELSEFLVEAPVARFCHLLPFPRENVLGPLYHRWKERCDRIDGTVGTASVFLFYSTVLAALLVDAREQVAGLVLFCVAYLILALRLCSKCLVKRWSAIETVLSLFVVETLGLVSLSLIYYQKKEKPLPPRDSLVFPDASPDYYYHTMALCSVMWCRHVDWQVVFGQRIVLAILSLIALYWKGFYLSEYLLTGPFETFFIVVAAFHFQKSARIFFVTELLASCTEDLAKSRYLLQQGILELLVPTFALPRVTRSLSRSLQEKVDASSPSGQFAVPSLDQADALDAVVSSSEATAYLIIRHDDYDSLCSSPQQDLAVLEESQQRAAAEELLSNAESVFKPIDDALLECSRIANALGKAPAKVGDTPVKCGDSFSTVGCLVQKVRVGAGQAVVAGPYLQGLSVTPPEYQARAVQQLLDLVQLIENSRRNTAAKKSSFTYVLTIGAALTVVIGQNPPQVDVIGFAARQAQAILEAAPPGLILIADPAIRCLADSNVQLPRFPGDIKPQAPEPWATRSAGLIRVSRATLAC